jgi:hypothetical protein
MSVKKQSTFPEFLLSASEVPPGHFMEKDIPQILFDLVLWKGLSP